MPKTGWDEDAIALSDLKVAEGADLHARGHEDLAKLHGQLKDHGGAICGNDVGTGKTVLVSNLKTQISKSFILVGVSPRAEVPQALEDHHRCTRSDAWPVELGALQVEGSRPVPRGRPPGMQASHEPQDRKSPAPYQGHLGIGAQEDPR